VNPEEACQLFQRIAVVDFRQAGVWMAASHLSEGARSSAP
jgi:hypothetical protein